MGPSYFEMVESIVSIQPCICSEGEGCIERGKITWDNSKGDHLHLRIDHCVINDGPIKRCDCIIFFQFQDEGADRVFVFVIEIKDKWYKLHEIKDKIQTCVDKLHELGLLDRNVVVIPVLYAEKHISNAKRTFYMYRVKIRGKPNSIKYLKHGERITKAISLKQT